jgi:hypothetical protein
VRLRAGDAEFALEDTRKERRLAARHDTQLQGEAAGLSDSLPPEGACGGWGVRAQWGGLRAGGGARLKERLAVDVGRKEVRGVGAEPRAVQHRGDVVSAHPERRSVRAARVRVRAVRTARALRAGAGARGALVAGAVRRRLRRCGRAGRGDQ